MYYKGKTAQGKLLERGFHGFGSEIRREMLKRVNKQSHIILDIGTGSGRNIRFLANAIDDINIFSIDPSLKALETVKENIILESTRQELTLIGGDAEHAPFKEGSFDLVFSVMSLHHIENIDLALQEMVRVLKTSGNLLVVDWTPKASELMNQPPSHFLRVDELKNVADGLRFKNQITEFPTWYISKISNKKSS